MLSSIPGDFGLDKIWPKGSDALKKLNRGQDFSVKAQLFDQNFGRILACTPRANNLALVCGRTPY